MTNHCSTIVPPSNFPTEFSYGKTTLNNNIMFNSVPNLQGGVQLNKQED